jgi:hypothetical protein
MPSKILIIKSSNQSLKVNVNAMYIILGPFNHALLFSTLTEDLAGLKMHADYYTQTEFLNKNRP